MRKSRAQKKSYLPDPKFKDSLVTRFVNHLMRSGKKTLAYTIFYGAMDTVEKLKKDQEKSSLVLWKEALSNIMPQVYVKSRRVGGSAFQVPIQIPPQKKICLAIKWMILYARKRNEKTMADRLAGEIIAASNGEGAAVKRREETHKVAESNRAYSHFIRFNSN